MISYIQTFLGTVNYPGINQQTCLRNHEQNWGTNTAVASICMKPMLHEIGSSHDFHDIINGETRNLAFILKGNANRLNKIINAYFYDGWIGRHIKSNRPLISSFLFYLKHVFIIWLNYTVRSFFHQFGKTCIYHQWHWGKSMW